MVNQYWFRYWFGAVKQQAITWANVDPDLCCHMVSLGHSKLIHGPKHRKDNQSQILKPPAEYSSFECRQQG